MHKDEEKGWTSYPSCLIAHNFYHKTSEFYEISRPFMVLYENLRLPSLWMTVLEITDISHHSSEIQCTRTIQQRPLHSHRFYEFTFVLSGEAHLTFEGEEVVLYPGDCSVCGLSTKHKEDNTASSEIVLFMLQPDFLYDLIRTGEALPNDPSGEMFADILRFIREDRKEDKVFTSDKTYMVFRADHDQQERLQMYNGLFNHLIMTMCSDEPGKTHFMKGYLCQIFFMLNDESLYTVEHHRKKTGIAEDIFIQASLKIEASLGNITRSQLEEEMGYSSDYVARIIRQFTGMSFVQYCQSFSLKEAARLLSDSDLPISAICETLGYSNRTYFNRIFSRQYDCKPGEYRQRFRGSPPSRGGKEG